MPRVLGRFPWENARIEAGTTVAFHDRWCRAGNFPDGVRDYSRSAVFPSPNFSMR